MRILLLFSFIICSTFISAQEEEFQYQLGARNHFGFFLTNSQILDYVTHQHVRMYEVYFEKKTDGSRQWQNEYKLPSLGVAFLMTDYQKKQHLGTAYSLYPYMNFQLLKSNVVQLSFHAGAGLAYLSKRFHPEDNRKNVAIGSKLNMSFSFLLDADWKLLKSLHLTTGIALNHFSNTSFQKPNQGLNLPSAALGLHYSFGNYEKSEPKKNEEIIKNDWQISAHAALAMNEIYPANGDKYLAKTLSLGVEKRSNYKSRLGGALDLFYSPANIQILKNDSMPLSNKAQNIQIGLAFQHTLMFGKFGLHTVAGYYLKTAYIDGGRFYQKVGGRYGISDALVANLLLKTHFASAEYLEIGFGYYFN